MPTIQSAMKKKADIFLKETGIFCCWIIYSKSTYVLNPVS